MRIPPKTFCLPLALLITACQPSGLYDSHGNYHSASTGYEGERAQVTNATDDKNGVSYNFSRPGFYDSEGSFVYAEDAPRVPYDFLPPEGMCRVFRPDQPLSMQAPAKACRAQYHLREGAYVIYGG